MEFYKISTALFASVYKVGLPAIFVVAVRAGRGHDTGGIDHLVLILGLSRRVGGHSRLPKLLNELSPIRILERNLQTIRALEPRKGEEVGKCGDPQSTVLDRFPFAVG